MSTSAHPDLILYIEPVQPRSAEPVIDELTRKMTAALRMATPGPRYRGFHVCSCGAGSSNCDYTLPGGKQTNSLAVHYLALHRDEVPEGELAKVRELPEDHAGPTATELGTGPGYAHPEGGS